jgi:hypothetical protein
MYAWASKLCAAAAGLAGWQACRCRQVLGARGHALCRRCLAVSGRGQGKRTARTASGGWASMATASQRHLDRDVGGDRWKLQSRLGRERLETSVPRVCTVDIWTKRQFSEQIHGRITRKERKYMKWQDNKCQMFGDIFLRNQCFKSKTTTRDNWSLKYVIFSYK